MADGPLFSGTDPGRSGALAAVDEAGAPAYQFEWKRVDKRLVNGFAYAATPDGMELFETRKHVTHGAFLSFAVGIIARRCQLAIIEKLDPNRKGGFGSKMQTESLLVCDRAGGAAAGILEAAGITVDLEVPKVWRKILHLRNDTPGPRAKLVAMHTAGGHAFPWRLAYRYESRLPARLANVSHNAEALALAHLARCKALGLPVPVEATQTT